MHSVWKLKADELRGLGNNPGPFCTKDIGDITVVCHTSNQSQLLKEMIQSAKQITKKITILDDCSTDDTVQMAIDKGCEIYSIPEGWIYTHGFGKLILFQQSICRSSYHFQMDTGERLFVNQEADQKLTENYYWTLRINLDEGNLRQPMLNRLFRSDAPLTFPAVIHGSPVEPQTIQRKLKHAELILFHYNKIGVTGTYYSKRKNRLYWRLLQKGYEQRTLYNTYWENEWIKNKDNYLRVLKEIENDIGELEETKEKITLVHKGNW